MRQYEYEITCDDEVVAGVVGPKRRAFAEAMTYALVYSRDGVVSVNRIKRELVCMIPKVVQ